MRAFLPVVLSSVLIFGSAIPLCHAGSLEKALMPGEVIQGHADIEADCDQCHVRFNKTGQDQQCQVCHTAVAADIQQHKGLHGRHTAQPCKRCHTEHKGRQADIIMLDTQAFDHQQTDFILRGAHTIPPRQCYDCHAPTQAFRAAPNECQGCHAKDDRHKGALGGQCAACHAESTWKAAQFDHAHTAFALEGQHTQLSCERCHKENTATKLPPACYSCHQKQDVHKGKLGTDCARCHTATSWHESVIDHVAVAQFALTGKHADIACKACHTVSLTDPLPRRCAGCHRGDDVHKGTLGVQCDNCHRTTQWQVAQFNHNRTAFALHGQHARVGCKQCHRNALFKSTSTQCYACHQQQDTHKGKFGTQCERCHNTERWQNTFFDHAQTTRFALHGQHAQLRCVQCHTNTLTQPKLKTQCNSCHQKHDPHKGRLGDQCATCHNEVAWQQTHFDHQHARFVLSGRHLTLTCQQCHKTQLYKDVPLQCSGCHKQQDVHKGAFGAECERCHGVRDWRLAQFDHDQQTHFKLEGAHQMLDCQHCHTSSAAVSTVCGSCHAHDDIHDGRFGSQCERCHNVNQWQEVRSPLKRD